MFIETRMPDDMAYGFSGGPVWRTLVTQLRNRHERRNIQSSRPQHQFRGSFDRRDAAVVAALLDLHNATYGAAIGFRFKNWLDYQATAQPLPAGTGASQTVQLEKVYQFGAQYVPVPIRKPNSDVIITADNTPISATIDTATGMATYTAPLGSVVRWSGTFDLPVRFATDEFVATLETYNAATIEVQLIEDFSA